MFSSPYPPPPPWALHQLVALYAFHTLMTPKCTFQPGPFPELQACISNCMFTPLTLPSWLLASLLPFLSSSLTLSSLSLFPSTQNHITSVICAHKLMRVCGNSLTRRAVRNESNSTLYRKGLPKPSLKCCTHQELRKKILIYKLISFMLMQPQKHAQFLFQVLSNSTNIFPSSF